VLELQAAPLSVQQFARDHAIKPAGKLSVLLTEKEGTTLSTVRRALTV